MSCMMDTETSGGTTIGLMCVEHEAELSLVVNKGACQRRSRTRLNNLDVPLCVYCSYGAYLSGVRAELQEKIYLPRGEGGGSSAIHDNNDNEKDHNDSVGTHISRSAFTVAAA